MKKTNRILCLFLVISVLAFNSGTTFANAGETAIPTHIYSQENNIEPESVVASVAVFVGGILAGYIVDGILILETGRTGGEWVAYVLSFHKKFPKFTWINYNNGTCTGGFGGGGGGAWSFETKI